ncbi:MAG: nitroreductase [Bacteroidaceae bacterium]|nr:nitroreductase [Bacteroidaceae bacterium]
MKDFETTVRTRQSIRKFLPTPLTREQMHEVLTDAQWAPSACNTQPWDVHIVSGEKLARIEEMLIQKILVEGEVKQDFDFANELFTGKYEPRWRDQYRFVFERAGVARGDKEARMNQTKAAFRAYGAPHVAFIFIPVVGDCVNVAADAGMYEQNFLLSLHARGFGGVPQLSMAMHADVVREVLGIPAEMKLLSTIAFGHLDPNANENTAHLGRIPVEESVTFHQ